MSLPDPRYARNLSTLSADDQRVLAQSHVLLVGLGGLGGAVLDQLLRLGVGHITGADGDVFEPSNLNRQLLATQNTLGQGKALAAAERAALVNPTVRFTPVAAFLDSHTLPPLVRPAHVVIDALGGLAFRRDLQHIAAAHGKPLVSAGIAGFTGWVAAVRPGEIGPADIFTPSPSPSPPSSHPTAEEALGNLAPVATLAASLQVTLALKLLLRRPVQSGMFIFDLDDLSLQHVAL